MKIKKLKIQKLIRNILREVYQSHTFEPQVGEYVENINPKCKHFKSRGRVVKVSSLPNDAGKLVSYRVTNDGNNYKNGNVLTKTLDQLAPEEKSF